MQNVFSFCFFCLKSYTQNQKNHSLFRALSHLFRIDTESATYHQKIANQIAKYPSIIPPKKNTQKGLAKKACNAHTYSFLHKKNNHLLNINLSNGAFASVFLSPCYLSFGLC